MQENIHNHAFISYNLRHIPTAGNNHSLTRKNVSLLLENSKPQTFHINNSTSFWIIS